MAAVEVGNLREVSGRGINKIEKTEHVGGDGRRRIPPGSRPSGSAPFLPGGQVLGKLLFPTTTGIGPAVSPVSETKSVWIVGSQSRSEQRGPR